MGQLLDIIMHEQEREKGLARLRDREFTGGPMYRSAVACVRTALRKDDDESPTGDRTIRAQGGVIEYRNGTMKTIGLHLSVRRSREVFKLLRSGASDATIAASIPEDANRPTRERAAFK